MPGETSYFVVGPKQIVQSLVASEFHYKTIQAGEPIVAGDIVYQDGFIVRRARGNALVTMDAVGLCPVAVASGITTDVMIRCRISGYAFLSGLTSGGSLYVSATSAGKFTQTPPSNSGDIVQFLGIALTGNSIEVNPRQGFQIIDT